MPVFNWDSNAFPLLTPEQTSPIGNLLSNAIRQRLERAKAESAEAEVPYAGIKSYADALSKAAYSQAVLPQLQAKLAGNRQIWANMTPEQQAITVGIASNTPNNNIINTLNDIYQKQQQKKKNGVSGLFSKILNTITGSAQGPTAQPQNVQQQNVPQRPMGAPQLPVVSPRTNEEPIAFQNEQNYVRGLKKAESLGGEEGKQQASYGEEEAGIVEQQKALQSVKNTLNNPTIENIANVPFLTNKSIAWFKQTGSKEQKYWVGRLESGLTTLVSSSFKMFQGRVTNNDLEFLKSMKPNENDTVDTMKGKAAAVQIFNETKSAQTEIASQYMKNGYSKVEAEKMASQEVDLGAIEQRAYDDVFNTKPKQKNNKQSISDPLGIR